jgi:putative membrane protein
MDENYTTRRSALQDDPRIPLAAERTMLAWIRTGLALMGFGFVVARFGVFLREMADVQHQPSATHGFSVKLGVSLIVLGVFVNLASVWKYKRYLKSLASGCVPGPDPRLEVFLGILLALVGAATAVYLLLFL